MVWSLNLTCMERCYARFPKSTANVHKGEVNGNIESRTAGKNNSNNLSKPPATIKALNIRRCKRPRVCHQRGCTLASEPIKGLCYIQERPTNYELDTRADLTTIAERVY